MLRHKAYSVFSVKSLDEEQRVLEGRASTPTPDRVGDVIEPKGAIISSLPLPFLWMHQHDSPIGHVVSAKSHADGIDIRVEMARTDKPGPLKDRLETAWESIAKLKLVRGLSIGFVPKEWSWLDSGSMHVQKFELIEVSAVTIPCNVEANIMSVKRFDVRRALPVVRLTGASGFRRDQNMTALKELAEGYAVRLCDVLRPLDQQPDAVALGILEGAQQMLSARIAARSKRRE